MGRSQQGMLLVGFSKEHGDAARSWMQQMEPQFLVSHCTAATLEGTVEQAAAGIGARQITAQEHQHVDEVMPRLVLLSGMSGEEAIAVAEHWEEFTGTPPPIFSTLVDKLLCRPMRAAILDIVKAHVSSKSSSEGMVDTAALRQMIRRKIEERQTAGVRLVSRDGGQCASSAIQQPIIVNSVASHHSQGCDVERKGVDKGNPDMHAVKMPGQTDAEQQHMQVAYAKQLLQAASPRKARGSEREGRRKESKEKIVRKGFG